MGGWIVGVFMAILAIAGLFLASSAPGNPTFYSMGLGLFAFGCILIFALMKQSFDHR